MKGMAHITGGGITENLPRVLPEGCAAEIDLQSWTVPPLFRLLQQRGAIATDEMCARSTWASGSDRLRVARRAARSSTLLSLAGEPNACRLGFVVAGERSVRYVSASGRGRLTVPSE